MRNKLIGLLVVTLLLVAIIVPGCEGEGESTTDFYIPFLTITSGPYAGVYAQPIWVFEETLDIINGQGGVRGADLTTAIYDSAADPTTAYTQMQLILEDDPIMIAANTLPNSLAAYSTLVIDGGYLAIDHGYADVTQPYRPWVFKMVGYTENQGCPALQAWVERESSLGDNITKVCIIADGTQDVILNDIVPLTAAAFEEVGVNVTDTVTYPGPMTMDYATPAAEAIATGADAFYIIGIGLCDGNLILALHNAGFTNNQHIALTTWAADADFMALTAGNVSSGCYMWTDMDFDCDTVIMQELQSRWAAEFPGQPMDLMSFVRFADLALYIKYGLETSGATNDPAVRAAEREDLRAALYNVADFGSMCGYTWVVDGVFMRDMFLNQYGDNNVINVLERISVTVPPGYPAPPLP